ncbi:MAG: chlorite dismutase, partial [Microbacteriaceae bacterium]|nr:chlorite dismutase [Microbacteriaceae bacterium]
MSTTTEATTSSEPTPVSGFTLWAVFRRDPSVAPGVGNPNASDPGAAVAALDATVAAVEADGVVVRGFYDVSSLRSDADIMVWLHGGAPETLQKALRELRRSPLLAPLLPTWNAMGVHRDAEFSAN